MKGKLDSKSNVDPMRIFTNGERSAKERIGNTQGVLTTGVRRASGDYMGIDNSSRAILLLDYVSSTCLATKKPTQLK